MGLFSFADDLLGTDFSGEKAERAAKEAAGIQAAAGEEAIASLRGDLAPFTQLGTDAASLLMESVLQPEATQVSAESIMSDPFFQALAQQQERDVLSQRAALGLGGSGGTEDLLTRNLLQLGEGFRQSQQSQALQEQQQRFNQLFNITGLGQASAAQVGAGTANLLTDIGAVRSTIPIADAQQAQQLTQNLLSLGGLFAGEASGVGGAGGTGGLGAGSAVGGGGGMFSFSDSRLKKNIVKVGEDEFGNIYEFDYIDNSGRFRGRIAQELRSIRPDAVSAHESGYLQVSNEFRPEAI